MAQTSDEVSRKAARLMNLTRAEVRDTVMDMQSDRLAELVRDIRAVAASALRQDEVKGWRKWFG